MRQGPSHEALPWPLGIWAGILPPRRLTLAVLPAGEEAVAGGTEALVAALSVSAGVLAQVPHPALVQVWARPGGGGGGRDTESQTPRRPARGKPGMLSPRRPTQPWV